MNKIKFIEYNGIEGYIELMKHDVEPLNNPDCKKIELYYDGKDIKAVLDYITNLQEKYEEADNDRHKLFEQKEKAIEVLKAMKHADKFLEGYSRISNIDKVLEILQGEDKDE